MVSFPLIASALCAAAAHPAPMAHPRGSFMVSTRRAAPALQPSEVYDKDYPVDMAKLTPEELRYKAQADYAKAVAKLKKEAAEAEAARIEMEELLKEYKAAEAAAARSKAEAEALLKNKNAISDAAVDADTKAKVE